jgi:hypothetical protein
VGINHKFMKDETLVASQQRVLRDLEERAAPLLQSVRSAL